MFLPICDFSVNAPFGKVDRLCSSIRKSVDDTAISASSCRSATKMEVSGSLASRIVMPNMNEAKTAINQSSVVIEYFILQGE